MTTGASSWKATPSWRFSPVLRGEKEQGVPQRDQFNNESIKLTEAIVREAIQNSVDARLPKRDDVTVRFRTVELRGNDAEYMNGILQALQPHLRAADWRAHTEFRPVVPTLVIEDFGTTGLTGSTTGRDDGSFYNFWRRTGISGKTGRALGRWGLGKTVFSAASEVGAFFGLTVREGETERLLMGECTLNPHEIDGNLVRAYGYFAHHRDDVATPVSDPHSVEQFRRHLPLGRRLQSGLSIVVPYAGSVTEEDILEAVVKNYYFPIAKGALTVGVNDTEINPRTLGRIADRFLHSSVPLGFVREVSDRRGRPTRVPDIEGSEPIGSKDPGQDYFSERDAAELAAKYDTGALVHVRFPIALHRLSHGETLTWIDVFLQRPSGNIRAFGIFVRGDMVVLDERRTPDGGYGAMIADEDDIVAFLGDAENPAHTSWNERAEKLRMRWRWHAASLRAVRNAMRNLYRVVAPEEDTLDTDSLEVFFSVADSGGGRKRHSVGPAIGSVPQPWRIEPVRGGFRVAPRSPVEGRSDLKELTVRVAYDVPRGDAFARHEEFDFDLAASGQIRKVYEGAAPAFTGVNWVVLKVTSPRYSVRMEGFDPNRDLCVRVEEAS